LNVAAFEVAKLLDSREALMAMLQEFLKIPPCESASMYYPNGKDTQSPHGQDEIYYALEGEGTLVCETGGREETVSGAAGLCALCST